MDIPVSKLRRMDAGAALPISTFSCDYWRAYSEGTTNNYYITDGLKETEVTSRVDMTSVNQHCGPEVSREGQINRASYAVEVIKLVHSASIGTYVEAKKNLETARQWIAERFQIEFPHDPIYRDAMVKVNSSMLFLPEGNSFSFGGYMEEFEAVNRLMREFGPEVLGDLPPQTRLFIEATRDIDKAVEWIFSRYRVFKGEKEEEVLFARMEEPDKKAEVKHPGVYFGNEGGGGVRDQGLKFLLQQYCCARNIIPTLLLRAEER